MKSDTVKLNLEAVGPATERPISVAIVAMGGQGGGVLTNWIVDLAETQGWVAQSTSVPGVAQRTGATIYYVEMMPHDPEGRAPILAQMPTPGDVDVVIASEFMEAGRSILRGIVTPDRTTLIASDHRALAVTEKMAPGEGIADSGAVFDAIGVTAQQEFIFDMNDLATRNGSVISSAMFGALAASGTLPFPRDAFYEVIRKGGKGVEASIRTFDAAFDRAVNGPAAETLAPATEDAETVTVPTQVRSRKANRLLQQLLKEQPAEVQEIAFLGLKKVVDFQDAAYGREYLDLLRDLQARDAAAGGTARGWLFTREAAKYLANAMAYDDIMRVADAKTRQARRQRIEQDLGLKGDQTLQTTEFMHPRMEELTSILPARLAAAIIARPRLYAWLDRRFNKGRRVKTYSLSGFVVLYALAGYRRMRRLSLRHRDEIAHRGAWLDQATEALDRDYDLGVEVLRFRRLIKGYSDTHDRGKSKFDKVMATARRLTGREDAAQWARILLTSAVKDSSHQSLDETIQTVETFV
ncbi:indolepyruvate oxidoreductase subunit beta family protein [Pseudodonghicola flavimaris]|uniref:Indolepyruvate oxidoreductase subunit beta family protein n=1 Tax=Pseudodonghicola flavimaris TaxID=3050036 RepID=A0ABT7F2B9_9RHOB|nr:indolepyruvate oxidoreductase subunit beta family protein [Pseudodonghicola flavimaris]MDK3018748.1 indolepyruvate oxidoreductase subunit beta family protein [Pseudodonghicola flavimaris]